MRKLPKVLNEAKKEHAPSDMALGARDRCRLFVLILAFITVTVIAVFVFVIALEPDRRNIDLLGPGRYFVSINSNQVDLHLRGSAGHRSSGQRGRWRTFHRIVLVLILVRLRCPTSSARATMSTFPLSLMKSVVVLRLSLAAFAPRWRPNPLVRYACSVRCDTL